MRYPKMTILVAFLIGVGLTLAVAYPPGGGDNPPPRLPSCWAGPTEDSAVVQVSCDYRDGAWWPARWGITIPACDDDAPGKPIMGTCWLADDDGLAVWPRPYASQPIYVLDH